MKFTLIISGSGGQGVMSIGMSLAGSAVEGGLHATFMPLYGPEQRGGSAKCTVIIDKDEIISPMAGKGGVLVAMNNMAYNKFINELEPGGILLYDSTLVTMPIERKDVTAIGVPADAIALEVGSPKVANVIVIGALIALTGIVSAEEFQRSLDKKFAKKSDTVRALNAEALRRGMAAAQK